MTMTGGSLLIPHSLPPPYLVLGEINNNTKLGSCEALTESSLQTGLQPSQGGLD